MGFNINKVVKQITKLANNNTAMNFAYNTMEAENAREWQTAMSNTSHQREVADLEAAGLNPVLSANQGAASYSAASASSSADESNTSAIASMLMNERNNAVSLKLGKLNYNSALATAAATRAAASMAAGAQMYSANVNAAAQRDITKQNNATTLLKTLSDNATARSVARINQSTSNYAIDHSRSGSFWGAFSSLFNIAKENAQSGKGPAKNSTYNSKF